jgi:rRNA maturation RNase YbeY
LIEFFSEDIKFTPSYPDKLSRWIESVIKAENHLLGDINYVFVSDDYLLSLNQKFLDHQSLTDIITFDQSTDPFTISGDIYISIDRIQNNAKAYNQTFERELKRVMVHGVLHLIGYKDKTLEEKSEMRKKEEAYLSL